MSWIGWIAAVIIGLLVLDAIFVGIIVTLDIVNDWRFRREYSRFRRKTD